MALFEPIQVGVNQLQHRIVLAPLTRLRTDENHAATALFVEYYSQRATSGGLLISEGFLLSPKNDNIPGIPYLYTDKQIESWRKVTDAVHAKGSVIFAQIAHFGRAGATQSPVGPSAIAARGINVFTKKPFEIPHEATKKDIQDIIQEFVIAAKNAIRAGFDGVELHGANGW